MNAGTAVVSGNSDEKGPFELLAEALKQQQTHMLQQQQHCLLSAAAAAAVAGPCCAGASMTTKRLAAATLESAAASSIKYTAHTQREQPALSKLGLSQPTDPTKSPTSRTELSAI